MTGVLIVLKPDEKSEDTAVLKSRIFLTHALKLINAPLVVDERIELIARIISEYLKVDDVSIFLKEQDSDMLVLHYSSGLNPRAIGKVRVPLGKGITGLAAQNRTYISTKNILKDPRNLYSMYAEDEKYPSTLAFPILWGDELVGTLNIRSMTEREFNDSEAEELHFFTESIAGSIKNAQLYESLEYKSKLLELSIHIASAISSSLDLDTILDELTWEISNGFGMPGVMIHLFDRQGEPVKLVYHGLKAAFAKEYPLDKIRVCMESCKTHIEQAEELKPFGDYMDGTVSSVSFPLSGVAKTMGVISLFYTDEPENTSNKLFVSSGLDVLRHISSLAGLAIEHAFIHSDLRELAAEDKNKLETIQTLYSRMSTIIDSIDQGIIAVDEAGIIQDCNNVAKKALSITETMYGTQNIDSFMSYKPSISTIIESGKELTNRVVTFEGNNQKFAAVVNLRNFTDTSGEKSGSVISFRPMEETVKLLSRFSSQRPRYTFDDIIGHDTTLAETVRLAKLAAQSNSNVLIVGESGTGKELFSQSIHNASPVADGPFIPVNCAAIPKDLIESELFGYAEGAFTGARKGGYIGKFEQATGGTIFLDEIGDMPIDLQVKLLRVLQEKVIQRVGAERIIPINTRVIAATNRDLKEMIAQGEFREELYWRLNVLTIEIPPLRDRKLDIAEFVRFFVEKYAKANNKEITEAEPAVVQKLMEYSWSGNIRELENAVEHAVLVSESDKITLKDLPNTLMKRVEEDQTIDSDGNIAQAKKSRIDSSKKLYREAIIQSSGDIIKAATKLRMSRATLYRRLKKYGLIDFAASVRKGVVPEE